MKLSTFLKIVLFQLALLTLAGCASTKNKDNPEMGAVKRLYQNTTARFNGYFNANELVLASITSIEDSYQDNYNQILPIYEYVALEDPTVVAQQLDQAIEKLGVVVSLHPHSDWVDDCYALAGKASFLKQDYETAEELLIFMNEEFSIPKLAQRYADQKKTKGSKKSTSRGSRGKRTAKEVKKEREEKSKAREKKAKNLKKERKKANKKRKSSRKKKGNSKSRIKREKEKKETLEKERKAESKEKENRKKEKKKEESKKAKPKFTSSGELDKPFLVRDPAFSEGLLWLAKTYVERERYVDAEIAIEDLGQIANIPKKIASDVPALSAHLAMKRKEWPRAIQYLELALEAGANKKMKARYSFILSQLYQKEGNGAKVISCLEDVLKFNPEYEMEFRAKLNVVIAEFGQGLTSREHALKSFTRLSKDEKNGEYLDQIYFGMAQLELKADNRKEAIEHLISSIENNSSNKSQLIESYYLLATLYFDENDFVNAKDQYDNTITVMSKDDERFRKCEKYAKNLEDIAANITVVTTQDSLLVIAAMGEKEQKKWATQMKKDKDREKKNPEARAGSSSNKLAVSKFNTGNSAFKKTSFFAYNDKALKKGKRDFDREWGKRTLADNWRRSNSDDSFSLEESDTDETSAEGKEIVIGITNTEISDFLKDVPKTAEDIKNTHKLIEEALYNLGPAFRDRLQNNERCIIRLEELLSRYPTTENELDAWYYLYLAHKDMGNASKAQYYYNKLLEKYPNSTNAKIISDPNYFAEFQAQDKLVQRAYRVAYGHFSQGNFQTSYNSIIKGKKDYPDNDLSAKFDLLAALCIGSIKGKKEYVDALRAVIADYKNTPEERRAKEILRVLGARAGSSTLPSGINIPDDVDEEAAMLLFKEDPIAVHYFIMAFAPGDVKITSVRSKVAQYNNKYHKLDRLRVAHTYLGADTKKPILTVRKFQTKDKAMKYFERVIKNKEEFIDEKLKAEMLVVSQNNYRALITHKSLDNYRVFFEAKYLNGR